MPRIWSWTAQGLLILLGMAGLMAPEIALSQDGFCQPSRDSRISACRRFCATDPEQPAMRIDRTDQFRLVDGRYQYPPGTTAWNWHERLEPHSLFMGGTVLMGGDFRPVQWRDIDPAHVLSVCREEGITDGEIIARVLFRQGDHAAAAKEYERLIAGWRVGQPATPPPPHLLTNLARLTEQGWGRARDPEAALVLLEEALADRPRLYHPGHDSSRPPDSYFPAHPRAQHNLATMLYWGNGTGQDRARAARLWQSAADSFDVPSLANLAWVKRRGEGVMRDEAGAADLYVSALRRLSLRERLPDLLPLNADRFGAAALPEGLSTAWLEAAAEAGQREAMVSLAYLLHQGLGQEANLARALDLYERAIRLYAMSPEFSPGPAFADTPGVFEAPAIEAWDLGQAPVDPGESDDFALMFLAAERDRQADPERPDEAMAHLREARALYERARLHGAQARAGKLLLLEAHAALQSAPSQSRALLERAADRLRAAAEAGHPVAQMDLSFALSDLGQAEAARRLAGMAAAAVDSDFFFPDMRPLLVRAITLQEADTPDGLSDARFALEQAARRAKYQGDWPTFAMAEEWREAIRQERWRRYQSFKLALEEARRRQEAAEIIIGVGVIALVVLGMAGSGGGEACKPPCYMFDFNDPIQVWGAMILTGI